MFTSGESGRNRGIESKMSTKHKHNLARDQERLSDPRRGLRASTAPRQGPPRRTSAPYGVRRKKMAGKNLQAVIVKIHCKKNMLLH